MATRLAPGKYNISSVMFNANIGVSLTKPTPKPVIVVGLLEEPVEFPVCTIEPLEEVGPWELPLYRICYDSVATVNENDLVFTRTDENPARWIIEHIEGDIYGIIFLVHLKYSVETSGMPGQPIAWTLDDGHTGAPVSLTGVAQTKSIPPHSLFTEGQKFRIDRVSKD